MKFFLLVASGLAPLLDFSVGSFIVITAGYITGKQMTLWHYIAGGLLALGPDYDIVYLYSTGWRRKNTPMPHHHCLISHRPLVVIPIVVFAGYALGGTIWAWIAGLCFFEHYLHDSKGFFGGGIAWFWPFSKEFISVWPLFRAHQLPPERIEYSREVHNRWLIKNYLRPSQQSLWEFSLAFLIVSTMTTAYLRLPLWSILVLFCVFWGVIYLFWRAFKAFNRVHPRNIEPRP